MVLLTSLAALLLALIPFDEVDTAEEFEKARTGNLVKDTHPPLFALEKARPLHESKVLRKRGDIASRKFGEVVHTLLTLCENLHDQQARGMSHRFDNDGPLFCGETGCFQIHQIFGISAKC